MIDKLKSTRREAAKCLGQTLKKALVASRMDDIEEARVELTKQLTNLGAGIRFYQNLSEDYLPKEYVNRLIDISDLIIENFYKDRYNLTVNIYRI